MEEKKTELDKEVRERNKKAIERRELFNDMWKKGEGIEVTFSFLFKF